MSEFLTFDDDTNKIVPGTNPVVVAVNQPRRDFLASAFLHFVALLVGIALGTWLTFLVLRPDNSPEPGPTPVPIDGGPAVLFLLNGDRDITQDQAQVAISQSVQIYADENGIDYRRYDVADDLSREAKIWQDMKRAAGDKVPAMITVDSKGVGKIKTIPESPEAAIEIIGKLKS